ncbi:MAG: hypothetical protein NTX61_02445 [Bacteroidetes bacterium]|nr:hypothetical protein [Bacteroidota bacterium]
MSIIKRTFLLPFFFCLFFTEQAISQCCSTGSPVGASVYIGILGKNTLRLITYYRRSYSDTYYEGTSKVTENNQLKSSNYNFLGALVGYGLTKRLTIEADFGYFINKTQIFKTIDFQEKGYGLSNGGVTVKYGMFVKPVQQIELTAGAGFRYPFNRTPQEKDHVQLSRDVQPSTNAFACSGILFFSKGFPDVTMRVFSMNRFDHNFADTSKYKYGDMLLNSLFVTKKIVKYFLGILQVRSEYRLQDEDDHQIRPNTGNWLILLSPQLSYSIAGKWNISILCDIPVYKDYKGKQLTPNHSVAISLTRDFDLAGSPKATKDIKVIR